MAVEKVRVRGVELRVETFGERDAPPVLLVAAPGESMEAWDPDFCRGLAAGGRLVIRYEGGDRGAGADPVAGAGGVVDALAGGRAHLVGLPAGGAIAERLGAEHPEQVATLTLIGTTPAPACDVAAPALVIKDPPRSGWNRVVPAILRHTDHRVRFAQVFDAETRAHEDRFRAATRVRPRDRVLDVGCGMGGSTREAARAATDGSVVGVDVSTVAVEEARRLSEADGLANVTYLNADAQVCPFPRAHFDLCISHFGVMFFTDPVAAFTNLRRALRPDARLALLVWQGRERNQAQRMISRSLGVPTPETPPGSDPYSLGDPATVRAVLGAAGFTEVSLEDVHEPVFYGPDVATAYEFVLGLRETREVLTGLDPAARGRARDRLRALLAAHETERGVLFDGRTWIITARRAP